ncbi:kinase-like domain-containing protein, partial [Schizophyllum commune]
PTVLDAIRLSDGLPVVLRTTQTWSDEVPILRRLNRLANDPRNYAVPVLDIIPLAEDDNEIILVLPLLRDYYDPPFSRLEQVVQALTQFFETMQLLHENNIAHRDFCTYNLMLDPSDLFPYGFHFASPHVTPDGLTFGIEHRDRADVGYTRYFVIDFGLATQLPSKDSRVTGVFGQDRTVPELSWETPYDPFKVDIYQFGRVILRDMVSVYSGLDFLRRLTEAMLTKDPETRPDIAGVMRLFHAAVNDLSPSELRASIHVVEYPSHLMFTPRPRSRGCCG